ncbi:FHA domain-containing protein [Lampropedia hyalina DSM 16112]|jgi:hypothetical protein|uniref:FHA domain-containing protein n=1 Tax=Lampropedia hyalina DSM 16112 TaxID=1122156 RepID=A0A1M4ZPC5_9BURK|nr:FHA domain-containing protein [Lampropedia hyalina]SHF19652.1 FHA domain-containing protein [Lampropedia hyalina DSM 16112]
MGYKLTVIKDGNVLKEYVLDRPETRIGRRLSNDLVLEDLTVSGHHALVHWHEGVVEIEDLDSTNGTFLDGKRIVRHAWLPTQQVMLGSCVIALSRPVSPKPRSSFATAFADTNIALPEQMGSSRQAYLEVRTGPAAGRQLVLDKPVVTLGTPGVAVVSVNCQRTLNRYTLQRQPGGTGTVLWNGIALGNDPVRLTENDRIQLADVQMVFGLKN